MYYGGWNWIHLLASPSIPGSRCSLAGETTCLVNQTHVPTNTTRTRISSDSAPYSRVFFFLTLALALRYFFGLTSHFLHVSANHEYRLASYASSDQCTSPEDRLCSQRLNQQESTHHRKSAVTGPNSHGFHDINRFNRTNGGVWHMPPPSARSSGEGFDGGFRHHGGCPSPMRG